MEIAMEMQMKDLERSLISLIQFFVIFSISFMLISVLLGYITGDEEENNSKEPKKTEKSEFVKKEIIREKNRKWDI